MGTDKEIWLAIGPGTTIATLQKGFHLNYTRLWCSVDRLSLFDSLPLPKRMSIVVLVRTADELSTVVRDPALKSKISALCVDDPGLLTAARAIAAAENLEIGLLHRVVDGVTLGAALELAQQADLLVIEFKDATNIPLELILATTQQQACRIVKRVATAEDGVNSFMTMESGVDVICLETESVAEITALDLAFSRDRVITLPLVGATVTALRQAGMGDRVCIDTTSELFADEGMLVGSTSSGGIVTCSETHELPYMELRPFRVNAGSLHLYVWAPENRTYYLSELRAGHEILVVNSRGRARIVTIGRLKIERRPLLYVEAEVDGVMLNTFIQDDWHVRLMGEGGAIRPSSEIAIGERLLAYIDAPGRHVGIQISETITER